MEQVPLILYMSSLPNLFEKFWIQCLSLILLVGSLIPSQHGFFFSKPLQALRCEWEKRDLMYKKCDLNPHGSLEPHQHLQCIRREYHVGIPQIHDVKSRSRVPKLTLSRHITFNVDLFIAFIVTSNNKRNCKLGFRESTYGIISKS